MRLEELIKEAQKTLGAEKIEELHEFDVKILKIYKKYLQGILLAIMSIELTEDASTDIVDYIQSTFLTAIQHYRNSLIGAGCRVEEYEKKFLI